MSNESERKKLFVLYRPAGYGLVKDAELLQKSFSVLGFDAEICEISAANVKKSFPFQERILKFSEKFNLIFIWKKAQRLLCKRPTQIYFHLENIVYQKLFDNAIHILIPNQEWFRISGVALLPQIDRVLCKSFLAQQIFKELGSRTFYTGFISDIQQSKNISAPSKNEFISRVGISALRGVEELVSAWGAHPEWPALNIVVHESREVHPCPANVRYVKEFSSADEYQKFSSEFKYQIFATETEGFGHAIYEGIASGAIVLLTNAPPMNEVVDENCVVFINAKYKGHKGLSPKFTVTREGLEVAVNKAMNLSNEERASMVLNSRKKLDAMQSTFLINIKQALEMLGADKG